MSPRRLLTLVALSGCGLAVATVAAVILNAGAMGVGSFDQQVVVESAKQVEEASYFCWVLDDATRRRAEETADPRLFEWAGPVPVAGGRFTAKVKFTTGTRFLQSEVFHMPHLVVLARFADGTRACRVVDLPPGMGKGPVVVSFS